MLFDDTYLTITGKGEDIFRDRGSKFLGFAYPLSAESDIKTIVAALQKEHPKANHHCWALRWSTDRGVFRLNDDGEPSGTAGRPILNTLLSRNLTNVAVVVVRYFGGTLLGVPGLINAYKTAAELALDRAKVIGKTVNDVYQLSFEYPGINDVMRLVKEESLEILVQAFDNQCQLTVSVRKTLVNQFLSKAEKLSGVSIKYQYTI